MENCNKTPSKITVVITDKLAIATNHRTTFYNFFLEHFKKSDLNLDLFPWTTRAVFYGLDKTPSQGKIYLVRLCSHNIIFIHI